MLTDCHYLGRAGLQPLFSTPSLIRHRVGLLRIGMFLPEHFLPLHLIFLLNVECEQSLLFCVKGVHLYIMLIADVWMRVWLVLFPSGCISLRLYYIR